MKKAIYRVTYRIYGMRHTAWVWSKRAADNTVEIAKAERATGIKVARYKLVEVNPCAEQSN